MLPLPSVLAGLAAIQRWGLQSGSFSRALSLTPEFKTRFYFPLQRLDQILDGSYPKQQTWVSKWKAYLQQFHKLRIDQIKDMLVVCAKRRAMPEDLWGHLRLGHWTANLAEATGQELASVLHSIAILNHSRQLKKGIMKAEPFVKGVLKQALQRKDIGNFSNVALSQCLYACALLELHDHALIPFFSTEISRPRRRPTLTTQSLANVLYSWAKLRYSDSEHVSSLSSETIVKRRQANEQEITNIMWAWGVLGHASREHWSSLMEEVCNRRTKLTAQGLSLVFIACARSGFRDPHDSGVLLRHVVESKKLVLFSTRVLSHLVWSLGKLQFPKDDPHLLTLISESLKASRLESASAQELCCIALGLSQLDHQDLDHCAALRMEIMKPCRLGVFNPQELCNLIWSLGKMSVRHIDCQKSLAAELVRRKDTFEQFSCQGLISVIVGWAHCGFSTKEDSNVVLREVMKQQRLKQYNPQELSNLCWAFGKLRIHSLNLFGRLADRMLQEDIIKAFTSQALSNILLGWAHGRFHDLRAVDIVSQQLTADKLKQLKTQEIANVCWSLGKLRYKQDTITQAIALEAVRKHRLTEYTPLQLSTVLLGWAKSDMRAFHLWDRLLSEFSSRQETIVVDMPILHNITLSVQTIGFPSLNAYRTSREKGLL